MKPIKKSIEKDLQELNSQGYISFCRKFNEKNEIANKYRLQEDNLPLYFTGDLNADVVSIDLNPQYNKKDLLNHSKLKEKVTEWASYQIFCSDFASYKYKETNDNNGIKSFDRKWIKFLNGFGIEKRSYNSDNSKSRVIESRNSKLQLEFVPYPSKNFKFEYFDIEYYQKRRKEILETINQKSRDFIFVTGNQTVVQNIFETEIAFKQLNLDNNARPYVGFKKIGNQLYCFLSSYKDRYGKWLKNDYEDYGKKCRKAYNNFIQ